MKFYELNDINSTVIDLDEILELYNGDKYYIKVLDQYNMSLLFRYKPTLPDVYRYNVEGNNEELLNLAEKLSLKDYNYIKDYLLSKNEPEITSKKGLSYPPLSQDEINKILTPQTPMNNKDIGTNKYKFTSEC